MSHLRVGSKLTGSWGKTENILHRISGRSYVEPLTRIGQDGTNQLRSATPIDTGLTSESWYSEMEEDSSGVNVNFRNTNVVNGFNVAVGLAEGHGTGTGGWVQGTDYINPVGESLFTSMTDQVWREVTRD